MNDTAPDKPKMTPASPARPGQEAVEASDSGRPWILGMAGAVMLVIGLIVGTTLWGAPKLTPHVEPFLQIVSNGEYARAYSQISQEWRAVTSPQQFEALHLTLNESMGKYQSMRQIHLEEQESAQLGVLANVVFDAQYEKGSIEITALLRKTPEGWSILGMSYDSPQFVSAWEKKQSAKQAAPQTAPPATQPAGN